MDTHQGRSQRPASHHAEIAQFYRELFANSRNGGPDAQAAPAPPVRPAAASGGSEEMSTEEFFRELFAQAQGRTPQALGPREGLEPPALPARFRRVRGGAALVSYELLVTEDGRIAAKHENVAGQETYFIYEYDESGHLLRAWRDGRLAEEYAYDGRGARIASWNPRDGQWKYAYDQRSRLTAAGPWQFGYAPDGALREAWTPQAAYFLTYDRAGGMSRVALRGNRVLRCETIAPGLPVEKYIDARPVESLTWRSPLQLATYRDHRSGARMQFHSTGSERLPSAVTVQTAQGSANYLLGYDQAGSMKAVAAMDGPSEGRVVKVVDYDSFGQILSDSNPGLFMPLAFAGGLRDRFTGLVRFCHRDYDPAVGRFTAPDPLGDTGGDHDLYDYCVDDPVGRVDPEGLEGEAAVVGASWLDDMMNATSRFFSDAKEWFTGAPSPSPADVTQGAAQAAADAAQAVTQGYDTLRTAGAQVSRTVPEAINNLPVSPKEAGAALKAGEVAQQVGAVAELDDIYQGALDNATSIERDLNSGNIKQIEEAQRDREAYFRVFGRGALREGAKIAPTPVGPGPIKR